MHSRTYAGWVALHERLFRNGRYVRSSVLRKERARFRRDDHGGSEPVPCEEPTSERIDHFGITSHEVRPILRKFGSASSKVDARMTMFPRIRPHLEHGDT